MDLQACIPRFLGEGIGRCRLDNPLTGMADWPSIWAGGTKPGGVERHHCRPHYLDNDANLVFR